MVVDPTVRRSILEVLYARRKADEVGTRAVAEELNLEVDLVEAYLDVLEQEGLVNVARRYGGDHAVQLTSRGLLEAKSEPEGLEMPAGEGGAATLRLAGPEETKRLVLDPGDARRRLQQQLDEVQGLMARGTSATLDEMKDWTYWTVTVLDNIFGENSKELWEFRGISGGVWPSGYVGAEVDGYRERLSEWRRLLRTWIREIDEFGPSAPPAERYIPSGSQLDAYVVLKDTVEAAGTSVTLVDPYTDGVTLQPLLSVNRVVDIRVLTVNSSKDFPHALSLFRQQWGGNIEARRGPKELHDRFLWVDDRLFFSGASFKDLGQKGSVIAEIRTDVIKGAVTMDIEAWWATAQPIA